MANTQTARVVDDRTSVRLSEFGYECEALEGEKVEVYQYGHHYGSMRAGFTCDCGMLYIVNCLTIQYLSLTAVNTNSLPTVSLTI